jgi:hypothetical protein
MSNIQIILFGVSVLFFIIGVVYFIYQMIKRKGKSAINKLFGPTVCLFASVFILRLCTGFYDNPDLNLFENLLNSLVNTLQTFSLDASYTETITAGKDLFIELNYNCLAFWYGIFVVMINICAPVLGGAVLLGILINSFPHFRLLLNQFRETYVFSELNQKAVVFAEDIIEHAREERKKKKIWGIFTILPLIVFTDAYVDEQDEMSSEFHERAKALGAICVKDDLLQLKFKHAKKLWYILIDENSIDNIHALTTLATEKTQRWKPECARIYVFSQNNEADSILKKLYQENDKKIGKVVIKVVREYTTMAYNLLMETPLYEPLLTKYKPGYSGEKELVVTIIGSGQIGTEIFLGTYWCGQLLDCKLKINVISNEAEKFKEKINYINPDILKSGIANDEILRIFPKQEKYAPPYAYFKFLNVDAETGELSDVLYKYANGRTILSSDYFVIALGTDELNMNVAAEIRRKVEREQLTGRIINSPVIAYSVYDSNTNAVVNDLYKRQDKKIYLKAFASLKDIYSYKNIFMEHIDSTQSIRYNEKNEKEKNEFLKDEYRWWARMARLIHIEYKKYSTGFIKFGESEKDKKEAEKNYWLTVNEKIKKRFDVDGTEIDKPKFKWRERMLRLIKNWSKIKEKIKEMVDETIDYPKFKWWEKTTCLILNWSKVKEIIKEIVDGKVIHMPNDYYKKNKTTNMRLMWLEHRRWNAFMRTKGFSVPNDDQWKNYAFKDGGDHKQMDLKLHPFVVECSELMPIVKSDWDCDPDKATTTLDYLDIASIRNYRRYKEVCYTRNKEVYKQGKTSNEPKKTDYKKYDFPGYDDPNDPMRRR